MTDWLDVVERSAVAEARRRTAAVAGAVGLSPHDRERAAIVATEATTNLLKHAGRGRFALLADEGRPALTILAIDGGPGIADLDRMLVDGQSTGGSSGTGLGAMRRQSDRFELHTTAQGTVLSARVEGHGAPPPAPIEVAALMQRHPGSDVCGDDWAVREGPEATALMVCDGLGHGPAAHDAALAVRAAFLGAGDRAPSEDLRAMSEAARATRGAVAMVVRVPHDGAGCVVAGVGNVSGLVVSGGRARRLLSRDGRLGAPSPGPRDEAAALGPGDVLILHSDGVRTLRELERAGGLLARSAPTIAAAILRDALRGNDDACVMVARRRGPAAGPDGA